MYKTAVGRVEPRVQDLVYVLETFCYISVSMSLQLRITVLCVGIVRLKVSSMFRSTSKMVHCVRGSVRREDLSR